MRDKMQSQNLKQIRDYSYVIQDWKNNTRLETGLT